jgi:hypothetical protein
MIDFKLGITVIRSERGWFDINIKDLWQVSDLVGMVVYHEAQPHLKKSDEKLYYGFR